MSYNGLNSKELQLVELLVSWGTKIKFVEALVGDAKAVLTARKLYKSRGVRPPNGMPGSAVATNASLPTYQSYIALSGTFFQLRETGAETHEAMISVYAFHMKVTHETIRTVNVNNWFSLARDLEVGNAGLYRCRACGGGHLWQFGVYRMHRRCMWCAAKIQMPDTAIAAATDQTALMT